LEGQWLKATIRNGGSDDRVIGSLTVAPALIAHVGLPIQGAGLTSLRSRRLDQQRLSITLPLLRRVDCKGGAIGHTAVGKFCVVNPRLSPFSGSSRMLDLSPGTYLAWICRMSSGTTEEDHILCILLHKNLKSGMFTRISPEIVRLPPKKLRMASGCVLCMRIHLGMQRLIGDLNRPEEMASLITRCPCFEFRHLFRTLTVRGDPWIRVPLIRAVPLA
jgi:hypothetical protein